MTVEIIDISHYQAGIDLSTFAEAGGKAVILKATEGTGIIDPSYYQFRAASFRAGLAACTYHFFRPTDPVLQARHYYNTVKPARGERMVCDFEDPKTNVDMMVLFLQTLLQLDSTLQLTVYSSNLIKEQVGNSTNIWLARNTSLWIAQYTKSTTANPTWPSKTWPSWSLWQYTDSQDIKGHGAPVDASRFNGDSEAMLKWFGPVGRLVEKPFPPHIGIILDSPISVPAVPTINITTTGHVVITVNGVRIP